MMENILSSINSPEDVKRLALPELEQLCGEIREEIILTVSSNGGHLSSNLGVVELTVAMHKVFSSPEDAIVWDVGHQAYTHKLLTGRREQIATIRTKGGLSGYPSRAESPYDTFHAGHSSTSISAALGLAQAKKLKNEPGSVVAVIGDGALTGGLAYEGLNNAGRFDKNFIVILNDNNMSISRNVGSMARYLAHIRTRPGYRRMKGNVENLVDKIPLLGKPLHGTMSRCKTALKHMLYNNTLFEDMGFAYYGPFDGHDLPSLIEVLHNARAIDRPVLVHVLTSKGKGYPFAESNPGMFHGIGSFDIKTGQAAAAGQSFSEAFGNGLCALAAKDERVCAITAAMQLGTCLGPFAKQHPTRFFDVGIAEEHAVTFASGLAVGGLLPVCAIYSTFLQRGYDQIIHDAALQNAHVVFAVDRAGVVGEDGETHQGLFDAALFNTIPNVTVFSPAYYEELYADLQTALYECTGVAVLRYPRGRQLFKPYDYISGNKAFGLYGESAAKIGVVTYGRLFSFAYMAAATLRERGRAVRVIKLDRVKPIDDGAVSAALACERLFFFEEGMEQGGVGEHFGRLLYEMGFTGKYVLHGVTGFVKHATMAEALCDLGLDTQGMLAVIEAECEGLQKDGEAKA